MGRWAAELVDEDDAPRYICSSCGVDVASAKALVWTGLMRGEQPALLLRNTVNIVPISTGRAQAERLSSGLSCRFCDISMGFRYLDCVGEAAQAYKTGCALIPASSLREAPSRCQQQRHGTSTLRTSPTYLTMASQPAVNHFPTGEVTRALQRAAAEGSGPEREMFFGFTELGPTAGRGTSLLSTLSAAVSTLQDIQPTVMGRQEMEEEHWAANNETQRAWARVLEVSERMRFRGGDMLPGSRPAREDQQHTATELPPQQRRRLAYRPWMRESEDERVSGRRTQRRLLQEGRDIMEHVAAEGAEGGELEVIDSSGSGSEYEVPLHLLDPAAHTVERSAPSFVGNQLGVERSELSGRAHEFVHHSTVIEQARQALTDSGSHVAQRTQMSLGEWARRPLNTSSHPGEASRGATGMGGRAVGSPVTQLPFPALYRHWPASTEAPVGSLQSRGQARSTRTQFSNISGPLPSASQLAIAAAAAARARGLGQQQSEWETSRAESGPGEIGTDMGMGMDPQLWLAGPPPLFPFNYPTLANSATLSHQRYGSQSPVHNPARSSHYLAPRSVLDAALGTYSMNTTGFMSGRPLSSSVPSHQTAIPRWGEEHSQEQWVGHGWVSPVLTRTPALPAVRALGVATARRGTHTHVGDPSLPGVTAQPLGFSLPIPATLRHTDLPDWAPMPMPPPPREREFPPVASVWLHPAYDEWPEAEVAARGGSAGEGGPAGFSAERPSRQAWTSTEEGLDFALEEELQQLLASESVMEYIH